MAQKKNIFEIELPTGGEVSVVRHRFGTSDHPRVSIVSGIRGDTPEGMRITLDLIHFLKKKEDELRQSIKDINLKKKRRKSPQKNY